MFLVCYRTIKLTPAVVVPKKQANQSHYDPVSPPISEAAPSSVASAAAPSPDPLDEPTMSDYHRPRRAVTRKSYLEIQPEDSDEEMSDAPSHQIDDDTSEYGEEEEEHVASEYDEATSSSEDMQDDDVDHESDNASEDVMMGEANDEESLDQLEGNGEGGTSAKKSKSMSKSKSTSKPHTRMRNLLSTGTKKTLSLHLPPMSSITDIFTDITKKALSLNLEDVLDHMGSRPLRVATMCSGTESPLLALEMIRDSLKGLGKRDLQIEHVFSAEVVPFKQAYIERNFQPAIIFRDIVEILTSTDGKATTAYGARVEIPADVDILIAGTACVDFSKLNRKQKHIEEKGESSDTFRAVLAYAKKWQPTMLVLENVKSAPWDYMLQQYDKVQYTTAGALVDTKLFYLPQTRERGYMVCVRTSSLGKDKVNFKNKWEDLMSKFKRPASSPTSSFLLPNDHSSILQSRYTAAQKGALQDAAKDIPWAKCELKHLAYRQDKGLGSARPYTGWQESGTFIVPDYADKAWHKSQVERVWDLEEICLLRKALPSAGRYDIQFKTRILDSSQNIDRETDSAPFGISSCLTPSGSPLVTDRGGPLTHAESLILQGIPLSKIRFTTETTKNVKDLAGNAMSSTPVISAILAALIAGFQALPKLRNTGTPTVMKQSQDRRPALIVGTDNLERRTQSAPAAMSMPLLIQDAATTSQKCYCEGQISIAEKPTHSCHDCGQSTCIACGNKPIHNYAQPSMAPRSVPATFIQKWRSALPLRIRFSNVGHVTNLVSKHGRPINDAAMYSQYSEVLSLALQEEFKFSHFHRGPQWTINYDAAVARLALVIGPSTCQWKLFAKPNADLPANSSFRAFLQQPIGRSTSDDFLAKSWEWRTPQKISLPLKIQGCADRVPSWLARLHMPGYENERIWQRLRIDTVSPSGLHDVSGTYEHLPDCGTACESLYKRIDDEGEPMFFFLDPDPIGQPADDKFVFSTNPLRLQSGVNREIVASLASAWRPWLPDGELCSAKGTAMGTWVSGGLGALIARETALELRSYPTSEKALNSLAKQNCSCASAIATSTLHESDDDRGVRRYSQEIHPDDKIFFEKASWLLSPLCADLNFAGWHDVDIQHDFACATCAPTRPDISWKLGHGQNLGIKPYEDPAKAVGYEIALKKRPNIFVVGTTAESDHPGVQIGLNVKSLVERASAKLQKLTNSACTGMTWTLDHVELPPRALPVFRLQSNDRNVSYDKDILKESLFAKQKQSLAWMRSQESGQGREILLEEAEEASLPHLGWRAEARAQARVNVRGGILADHPGFGKTVTSLALIHAEFDEKTPSQIVQNMHESIHNPGDAAPQKIPATLILCPPHLIEQWEGEIEKFLGKEYATHTIVFRKTTDLLNHPDIFKFEEARIVLASQDILSSDSYLRRLAKFAAMPEPLSSRARDFKVWLDLAVRNVYAHTPLVLQYGVKTERNKAREEGSKALERILERKFEEHLNDKTLRAFAQSKRYKGAAYSNRPLLKDSVDDNDVTHPGLLKSVKQGKLNAQGLARCSLLHMFHFNRLIIDEFTYLKPQDYASITTLRADKRWALSATPPLRDPYDVSMTAKLIGVNLRIGGLAPGIISTKNIEAARKDMTEVELFENFQEISSQNMRMRTHELAQIFLNSFVRQNILEFTDFVYNLKEQIVPVRLRIDHRIFYTELAQQLNSQDMRITRSGNKTAAAKGGDQDKRIFDAFKDVESAEEALTKTAAFFQVRSSGHGQGGVEGLLQIRNMECKRAAEVLTAALSMSHNLSKVLKGGKTPYAAWKMSVLDKNVLGDIDITNAIVRMAQRAEKMPPKPESRLEEDHDDDDESDVPKPKAKSRAKKRKAEKKTPLEIAQAQISATNQDSKRYLAAVRSIRFVKNVQRLQQMREQRKEGVKCDFAGCARNTSGLHDLAVSSVCGHILCRGCYDHCKTHHSGVCQASKCKSVINDFHLLWESKMGDIKQMDGVGLKGREPVSGEKSMDETDSEQMDLDKPGVTSDDLGEKATAVVSLLKDIKGKGEKAILFVLYKQQIKQIAGVLKHHGISYAAADTQAATAIKNFKSNRKVTVIIFGQSDEGAAGTNLTEANHIIMYSPLLADSQYKYESQSKQAIGRVQRPGQNKDIFIYRLAALDTIDVDILEHRERRKTILAEKDTTPSTTDKIPENERTQLIQRKNGKFELVPKSILLAGDPTLAAVESDIVQGSARVRGYVDFSSLIKFSKAFSEDD